MEKDKNIKLIDLSKREYKAKEIDSDDNGSHISNDKKYLAYGDIH